MKIKSQIDNEFIKVNDIDSLSHFIKNSVQKHITLNMGAATFNFKLGSLSLSEEVSLLEGAHATLTGVGYDVYFNLDERVFSVKW